MTDLLSNFPERWLPHVKCESVDWAGAGTTRKYYILMTGRCGSTHLVDLLRNTNKLGWPEEYFNERLFDGFAMGQDSGSFCQYLSTIAEKCGRGGIFGFKIDIFRLLSVLQLVNFPNIFPPSDTSLMVMTRIDILTQAYSFAVARATGEWHDTSNASITRDYDPSDKELWFELFLLASAETKIEKYVIDSGRNALRFTYEDLLQDRNGLLERIFFHIGVDLVPSQENSESHGTSVRAINYNDRQKVIRKFKSTYRVLLEELISNRTTFNWSEMSANLRERHGIVV